MKTIISLMFFAILFCCAGCSTTDSTKGLSGTYTYTGYNGNSSTIVSGTLQLDIQDSANVTGSWQLSAVTNMENIGPQTGTGDLIGGFADGTLIINLNPGWADNNVILAGDLENNYYTGIWQYVGFAGIINEGTFTAEKN